MRRLLLLLVLTLAACTPVQDAVADAVRAVAAGDDGATLTLHPDGVTFDPVEGTALDTVLYIGGEGLRVTTEEPDCQALRRGITCFLGDVSEAVTVTVVGTDRSANVSYYREGSGIPKFFYVFE